MDPILEQSIENIFKLIEKNSLVTNQKEINNYLSNIAKTIENKNKEFNKKFIDLGDNIKDLNKSEFNLVRSEVEITKKSNKTKKDLSITLDKAKTAINQSVDATTDLYFSFYKSTGSFDSLLAPLRNISNLGIPIISALAAGAGAGAALLMNEIDKYRNIGRAGVQMSEGLLGARQAAAALGLSFEQFSNNISQYSSVIQKTGLANFTEFFKDVRQGSNYFYELGLSSNELSNYAATYLEINRQINEASLDDLSERQRGFDRLLMDFYKTVQMTSGNIEDLMQSYLRQVKDPKTRLAFLMIPEQSRAALIALRENSPLMAEVVEESLLTGNIAASSQYGALLQSGLINPTQEMVDRLKAGTDFAGLIEPLRNSGIDYDARAKFFFQVFVDDTGSILAEIGSLVNRVNEQGSAAISPVESNAREMIKSRELLKVQKDNIISGLLETASNIFTQEQFENINSAFADLPNTVSNLITGGSTFFKNIDDSSMKLRDLDDTTKNVFLGRNESGGSLESSISIGFDSLFVAALAAGGTSAAISKFGTSITGLINNAYSGINFGSIFDSYDQEIDRVRKNEQVKNRVRKPGKGRRADKIKRAKDFVYNKKVPGQNLRFKIANRFKNFKIPGIVSVGSKTFPLVNLFLSMGESFYENYTQSNEDVQNRLNISRDSTYADVYELFLRDIAANFISNMTLGTVNPNFDASAQRAELLSRGYALDEVQLMYGDERSRGLAESFLGTRGANLTLEIQNLQNLRSKIEQDQLIKEKQILIDNIDKAIKERNILLEAEAHIARNKNNASTVYTDEFGNLITQ